MNPTMLKRHSLGRTCMAGLTIAAVSCGAAWADADGPDAWRVVDVAPDDALNARMGPGTDYRVIGQFAHDARGLRQITCVPLLPPEIYYEMSEAERDGLPPRWCLMQSPDYRLEGWVALRFLAEDQAMPAAQTTEDSPAMTDAGDSPDVTAEAERLVQRLYDEHLRAMNGEFTSPLHPARAGDFFTEALVEALAGNGLGADPLFDAQDVDITDLKIALDEEQPMFRGLITVNADFRNFGRRQRAAVNLRYEDGVPRVIRIAHEGWTFE